MLAVAMWGRYNWIANYYIDFKGAILNPSEHKRIPMIERHDFPMLLKAANQSQVYQITPPAKLNTCYQTVIILSKEGFVSQFGILEGEFKDQKRFFWNANSGTVNVDATLANDIEKALEPIIAQRRSKDCLINCFLIRRFSV